MLAKLEYIHNNKNKIPTRRGCALLSLYYMGEQCKDKSDNRCLYCAWFFLGSCWGTEEEPTFIKKMRVRRHMRTLWWQIYTSIKDIVLPFKIYTWWKPVAVVFAACLEVASHVTQFFLPLFAVFNKDIYLFFSVLILPQFSFCFPPSEKISSYNMR